MVRMGLASERIAHGQVEAEGVLEARHVVVAALARVVRCVDAHTHIEAQYQELQVIAQAESAAERYLLAQPMPQRAARTVVVLV